MFTYCVTCLCLTPLGDLSEVTQASGIYTAIVKADSQQDAELRVKQELAGRFSGYAVVEIKEHALTALDPDGHIVNLFWNFGSHRV